MTAPTPPTVPPAPPTGAPAVPPPPEEPNLPDPEYVPVGGEEVQIQLPSAKEAWTTYSPEELAGAQKTLADMKPEDLLQILTEKKALESPLPEAGGIAFCELESKTGVKINVTGRGATTTDALINLVNGVKFAGATWGFTPVSRGGGLPIKQQNGAPAQQQSGGRNVVDSGTSPLHSVEVEPPGKDKRAVKFQVGKFQHPFSDARIRNEDGAEVICKLFDPALGWTPAHFQNPAFYNLEGKNYQVDWEKVATVRDGKTVNYYNVIRVHL